ncbi:MAG: hypothetical protein ACFBSD_09595 [Paracoccaceae bacterium]
MNPPPAAPGDPAAAPSPTLGRDDIAAAVAAGLLSEAQAASLLALAERRSGYRDRMGPEDEPFELFRGLNEIFVATGLALLLAGLSGTGFVALPEPAMALGLTAAAAWALAEYFTRIRRMVLPSLLLATAFVLGTTVAAALLVVPSADPSALAFEAATPLWQVSAAGAAAALAFYVRFRLPFALFLTGVAAIPAVFVATGAVRGVFDLALVWSDPARAFDLAGSARLALTTLGFGLTAFALAMAFDMTDPHRVSRRHRAGFWLHLLAAPAIVNTLALTLWRDGSPGALALLALALASFVTVALAIDRRSLLLAAAAYLGLLLGLAADRTALAFGPFASLLLLGAGLTALGAGWTAGRGRLMRALPEFPGKAYLPPYAGRQAIRRNSEVP